MPFQHTRSINQSINQSMSLIQTQWPIITHEYTVTNIGSFHVLNFLYLTAECYRQLQVKTKLQYSQST